MARLFIAAWPSEDALEALRSLPRRREDGVRFIPPDQLHVTVRFLGATDEENAATALAGLRFPSRTVTVGPTVERLAPDVVVAPVAGLDDVAAVVRRATAAIGEPPDPRPFRGHVTLARTKAERPCSLDGAAIDATFTVEELALVRSELHADGARYRTVAVVSASS